MVNPPESLDADLAAELADLRSRDRLRSTVSYAGKERIHLRAAGQPPLISFCSNDYLGLATHPAVRQAAADSAHRYGVGAGASRLVCGESGAHRLLEEELASFLGVEQVLTFPSGYQANIGTLTALAGAGDLIASDSANHASIIDGCRLSRARVAVFEHANPASAARVLTAGAGARRRFLITESLFSMDGDRAPLAELAAVASATSAHLIVDEAHALGVLGPAGRGLCAAIALHPTVLIGTLGKTFGTAGGFAATSTVIRDALVNRARTYIYTTAQPGPIIEATRAALRIVGSSEGDRLRHALSHNLSRFRASLARSNRLLGSTQDHILPVLLGSDRAALVVAERLKRLGFLIPAIRPPTVPEGTSRLRVTLSAAHTDEDLRALLAALTSPDTFSDLPLDPASPDSLAPSP